MKIHGYNDHYLQFLIAGACAIAVSHKPGLAWVLYLAMLVGLITMTFAVIESRRIWR